MGVMTSKRALLVDARQQPGRGRAELSILRVRALKGPLFLSHPIRLEQRERNVDREGERTERWQEHPAERQELAQVDRMANLTVETGSDQAASTRHDAKRAPEANHSTDHDGETGRQKRFGTGDDEHVVERP